MSASPQFVVFIQNNCMKKYSHYENNEHFLNGHYFHESQAFHEGH